MLDGRAMSRFARKKGIEPGKSDPQKQTPSNVKMDITSKATNFRIYKKLTYKYVVHPSTKRTEQDFTSN